MDELLKQSASEFNKKLDKRVEDDGFTYLYESRDEIDSQAVLDWCTKQMQLAYEKGREDGINQIKEEHRNEAINWYD